jgi:hypothetical protein
MFNCSRRSFAVHLYELRHSQDERVVALSYLQAILQRRSPSYTDLENIGATVYGKEVQPWCSLPSFVLLFVVAWFLAG